LGAEVVSLGVTPDGLNINRDCGTLATQAMQRAVVENRAHLGLALDGDADRLVAADEKGRLLDGDQLMALIATIWRKTGRLTAAGIVSTVMSNLGFERYLAGLGVKLARTQVGDRYVVEEMRRLGSNLGGEQSGHIILGDHSTTGDGLIAALQVLAAIVETGAPASRVCRLFEPVPQLLRNVRINGDASSLEASAVMAAISSAQTRLGAQGRLLVRKSGTEPLIRIMAEGEDKILVAAVVEDIAAALAAAGHAEESAAE
jgi:phosphoglucosamine mutase